MSSSVERGVIGKRESLGSAMVIIRESVSMT